MFAPLNILHCPPPLGNRTKSGAIPVGCMVYISMQVAMSFFAVSMSRLALGASGRCATPCAQTARIETRFHGAENVPMQFQHQMPARTRLTSASIPGTKQARWSILWSNRAPFLSAM